MWIPTVLLGLCWSFILHLVFLWGLVAFAYRDLIEDSEIVQDPHTSADNLVDFFDVVVMLHAVRFD